MMNLAPGSMHLRRVGRVFEAHHFALGIGGPRRLDPPYRIGLGEPRPSGWGWRHPGLTAGVRRLYSPLSQLCGRGDRGEGAGHSTLTPNPAPAKPGEGNEFIR